METLDTQWLTRELDRTKSAVFLGSNAAFLGSIMCSMNFIWSSNVPTAETDSISIWWNPEWFTQLPVETRKSVLLHELWHVARLHPIRRGSRSAKEWNWACDIRINNDLATLGHTFEGVQPWIDPTVDANGIMAEEDIYDLLIQNKIIPPPGSGSWGPGNGDLIECTGLDQQNVINTVVRAIQQAKISNGAGTIPGGIEQLISVFLAPIVPWEKELMEFFTDMLHDDYSWKRPNRRYYDMYLPSRFTDDGRLEHLMYFLDVSGSVSDADVFRFNSEVKYIQEQLKPQRLSLIQFQSNISAVKEFAEDDPFDEIKVVGRGGTNWSPVKAYIDEHQPTAAIVFTDMGFNDAVDLLEHDVPIIWVVIDNKAAKVPFGRMIHIH